MYQIKYQLRRDENWLNASEPFFSQDRAINDFEKHILGYKAGLRKCVKITEVTVEFVTSIKEV